MYKYLTKAVIFLALALSAFLAWRYSIDEPTSLSRLVEDYWLFLWGALWVAIGIITVSARGEGN